MSCPSVPGSGLREPEVHVWIVSLADCAGAAQSARPLLSPDEEQRAGRYRFPHLADSFAASRGALRMLLARYSGCSPKQIEFAYGPQGKPYLRASRLCFNVSHSGDFLAGAFALDCELGIDIERIRPMDDADDVARRFFHPEEVDDIGRAEGAGRQAAWFRCWTRKEAYVKAAGGGLSIRLESFRVSVLPEQPVAFLKFNENAVSATNWALHDFIPSPGYAGALVVSDSRREVFIQSRLTAIEILSNAW